ncbi:MAG: PQQ-binding-like beta-propeller repeat protein [Pirellulaceae bacterium]
MAKTAQEFLDHLANNDLIPPEVLESLRRQVAKATKPVSSGTLARLLVDNGHLTETQGERLSGAALPASKKSSSSSGVLGLEPIGETPAKPAPPSPKPAAKAPSKTQAEINLAAEAIGLAPIQNEPKPAAKPAPAAAVPKPTSPAKPAAAPQAKPMAIVSPIDGLMALDDIPSAAVKPAPKPPASPPAKPKTAAAGSPSTIARSKAAPAPAAAPLIDGLEPLTSLPGDDLFGPAATGDPFAAAAGPLTAPMNLAADPLAAGGPLAANPLTAAPSPAAQRPTPQPAAPAKPRSKVLLVIAYVVVLLLVIGGCLGFVLTRSNGDKEFELAEQDYQAKSYDGAITKLSVFLEDFPANSKAGTARIHRAMAKILVASPTKDNSTAMLPAAKTALGEIGGEKELSQLHAELAPLLMDMAANLAEQAKQGKTAAESAEKLAQAKEALALANDGRFVPGSLRQWQRMADVEESLALLERDLSRGKSLDGALAEIKKNAEGGKLEAVLAERTKLLLAYPELAGEIALKDLGKTLGKPVAALVKSAADSSKADTAEAKSPVLASLALSSGKQSAAAETPDKTFFALSAGTVWALDGGSGKLLWSRPVGRNSGSAVTPSAPDGASPVVLTDLLRNEVVCVNPRSGALVWRHGFKESLTGEPLVIDGQVIVATAIGKLFALDAQSGNGKSIAQLPQGVRLSPVGGSGKVFVVAEHSFLYILSSELKCEAAVYLGHDPGSVDAPPAPLAGHVIVAENRLASSLLHVVGLDEKGLAAGPMQQVEVAGLVRTPMVRLGERLLVLTEPLTVSFDYQPADDEPLKKLGETAANTTAPLARFGAVLDDKLWVAEEGLRRFDFIPAGGTLKEAWEGFAGETQEAPPQAVGEIVFCVRRNSSRPGVIATAIKSPSGASLWETFLAQPLTSLSVAADGQAAVATTVAGTEVKIDSASLVGSGVQFVPPAAEAKSAAPVEPLAAPPLSWAGGRLCVATSGSVELLDGQSAAPLAEPFQLSIRAGSQLANCSVVPAGPDGESVVISDGRNSVYHLRLEKTPQPRLILTAKISLKSPAISHIAVLDKSAYVVDQTGTLQVLALPDLKAKAGAKLACRDVVMGPAAAGKRILLETDVGELVCLDSAGKQLWKVALAEGPLSGRPLEVGGDILLPTKRGVLLRVGAATGKEIARSDLSQPLAGSPALLGTSAIVPTAAGRILKVAIPEKK